MRLIDADAFKEYCRTGLNNTKATIRSWSMRAFAEELTESFVRDIDEQPTVRSEYQVNIELTEEQLRELVKKMKNAPIVALSPDPGWIPCSKRFPKQDDLVLCSDRAGYVYYGYWSGLGRDFYTATPLAYDAWQRTPDVVAWMPLPEPWEGDAE